MKTEIEKLDVWLKKYRKDFYAELNSPALDTDISDLEKNVGFSLPEDYKLFLKWRNGQKEAIATFHPLTNETFMSVDDIADTFKEMKELLHFGDIDEDTWKPTWLPIMDNGGGNHTCIDLSPDNYGNVVAHDHEDDDEHIVYDSVKDWIVALNKELATLDFENWDMEECQ